jgi:hypothetical protein
VKARYKEGDVCAVPLRIEGYALGVIARVSLKPGLILGYFFSRKYMALPDLSKLQLEPLEAEKIVIFGDLGLIKNQWPVLGQLKSWERTRWPVPDFFRKDELFEKAWKVRYADDDISKRLTEEPVPYDQNLESDSVYGAGAVEILLTNISKIALSTPTKH